MESELITWLRKHLPSSPALRIGPGDDAAVMQLAEKKETVVTVDLLTEGVHFLLERDGPRRVGRKALAVNLSDLAAMAARPVAAVIAIALPRQGGLEIAVELYEGLLPLAEEHGLVIAGGDTNSWDGPLVISATLFGEVTDRGPLLRSGGRVGDQLLVTGSLGGSILGRQFEFQPRVKEALLLNERYTLSAGLDCSDGLSLDLSRLCAESGCGAALDLSSIPIAPAAEQLATQCDDGVSALTHALSDGEDFELILAVPPEEARRMLEDQPLEVPLTWIGELIDQPGLWKRETVRNDDAGQLIQLTPHGYEHKLES